MAFLETPRFPTTANYGYTSRPKYSVTVVRRVGGHERRNRNWTYPLHQFNLTIGPYDDDAIQEILEYWHALGGIETGFRFKDWVDYKSCRVSDVVTNLDQPLVLADAGASPRQYQLTKRYTKGARIQDRLIKKPVSGTIVVADNGSSLVENTDYSIDYGTGLVTMLTSASGSPIGSALTWGGEFDVPVRFEDDFAVQVVHHQAQSVPASLMELRL